METTVIVEKDIPFHMFYVVPLADFHLGAQECAVDVIRGYIDWIQERDNAYTILNGDLMNCAIKDSSSELFDDLTTPDTEYNRLRMLLSPIQDKVLMVTRGTHEGHIYRRVGADYSARLAFDLGDVPYRPDGGMVMLSARRRPDEDRYRTCFTFYATHGWGGARTIGSKVKKVEELATAVDADVYILSHDHTQNVHRFNHLVPSHLHDKHGKRHLVPHRKLLVNTGGFLKYGGYVAQRGLSPQDLGTPRIRCEVKHERVNGKPRYYKDLHASI